MPCLPPPCTAAGPSPRRPVPPRRRVRAWPAALGLALLLGGCATAERNAREHRLLSATERVCVPQTRLRHVATVEPAPPETRRRAADALAARGYSRTAIGIAEVIDALPLLERLAAAEAAPGTGGMAAELRQLRLRQAVDDRVTRAMLDVASTLAVIDCEGERGDGLRARLQSAQDRRVQRLSLAGILLGAASAAVSGGLSLGGLDAASDVAEIAGGAAGAGVALSLLFGEASGPLRTSPNLLREVWEGPDRSTLYPYTVWHYLTRPRLDDASAQTPAALLVAEWRADGGLDPDGTPAERERFALLFGPGGNYTIQDLELRDSMLDLLEASIALMNEDLRVLLAEMQAQAGGAGETGNEALLARGSGAGGAAAGRR
ncbi:hypothetical protein M0638_05960 [Roseomonas sp. NAR14]|uniref:Uncharacterized protein n=1 Tax=Roseomonas acroporae TaxID=2937791 RepID=A0A9X1Y6E1_9PROT|nr:hypothetical protein [Roseomonas acroporae]MCK8783925.1 hypothetical protein [Roseomonas acroporae]